MSSSAGGATDGSCADAAATSASRSAPGHGPPRQPVTASGTPNAVAASACAASTTSRRGRRYSITGGRLVRAEGRVERRERDAGAARADVEVDAAQVDLRPPRQPVAARRGRARRGRWSCGGRGSPRRRRSATRRRASPPPPAARPPPRRRSRPAAAAAPRPSPPFRPSRLTATVAVAGARAQRSTSSSWRANRSSVTSSQGRPSSCAPIGQPSELRPAGTLSAGHPSVFHTQQNGHAAVATWAAPHQPSGSSAPTGNGCRAVVGVRTTSATSKIRPDLAGVVRLGRACHAQGAAAQQAADADLRPRRPLDRGRRVTARTSRPTPPCLAAGS